MELSRVQKYKMNRKSKRIVKVQVISLIALSTFAASEFTSSTYALFQNTQSVHNKISAAVAFPDTIKRLEDDLTKKCNDIDNHKKKIEESYISACNGDARNAIIQYNTVLQLRQQINTLLQEAEPLLKQWTGYKDKASIVVNQDKDFVNQLEDEKNSLNRQQSSFGAHVRSALAKALSIRSTDSSNSSALNQAEQNVTSSLQVVDSLNAQKAAIDAQISDANSQVQSATDVSQYIQKGFSNQGGLETVKNHIQSYQNQALSIDNALAQILQVAQQKQAEEAKMKSATTAPIQVPALPQGSGQTQTPTHGSTTPSSSDNSTPSQPTTTSTEQDMKPSSETSKKDKQPSTSPATVSAHTPKQEQQTPTPPAPAGNDSSNSNKDSNSSNASNHTDTTSQK